YLFFFQAEDGIRDRNVTGVQTCALPISIYFAFLMNKRERQNKLVQAIQQNKQITASELATDLNVSKRTILRDIQDLEDQGVKIQIGRASCRERVKNTEGGKS